MQDKELYQHILGLTAPWTVSEVKLDMDSQEIRVRVQHPRGTKFCCPECQKELACYDHGEERQWRHLDSCQFKTILLARVQRNPNAATVSDSMLWMARELQRAFPADLQFQTEVEDDEEFN
jgi:hypothetical protein